MSDAFENFRREIEACPATEGVTSLTLMNLPENVRRVLNTVIRKGPQSAEALAETFGVNAAEMRALAEALVAKGYLLTSAHDTPSLYRPHLARTRELPSSPPNR